MLPTWDAYGGVVVAVTVRKESPVERIKITRIRSPVPVGVVDGGKYFSDLYG